MPYVAPHTIAAGELVTITTMNSEWGGNISFLANPPACRVYSNQNQQITNVTDTAFSFTNERFDTDGMWSAGTPTRITLNKAGLYHVAGNISYAIQNAGMRALHVRKNGTVWIASVNQQAVQNDFTRIGVSTLYKFAAGDYVELITFQTSGVPVDVLHFGGVNEFSPEFSAVWVGLG